MKLFISLCHEKMRVQLISKRILEKYSAKHNQSKAPLQNWLEKIKSADWQHPGDIIFTFNNANVLGKRSNRVVFNIGGNKYRIICAYHFGNTKVRLFIKWIGTHAEYSKLCISGKQYKIESY